MFIIFKIGNLIFRLPEKDSSSEKMKRGPEWEQLKQ